MYSFLKKPAGHTVYKKPAHTDCYLNKHSNHHSIHKKRFYKNFTHDNISTERRDNNKIIRSAKRKWIERGLNKIEVEERNKNSKNLTRIQAIRKTQW